MADNGVTQKTHSHYRIVTRRGRSWKYLPFPGSAAINELDRLQRRLEKAEAEWPEKQFSIQEQTVKTVKSPWAHLDRGARS
jgi:hypothetical protein